MIRPLRLPRWIASTCILAGASIGILSGCQEEKKPIAIKTVHDTLPEKIVPAFMKGTIWEKVDVGNTEPFQVSGYGLVVNLDNTGDTTAPTAVKEFMVKQMTTHGFGSKLGYGYERQTPDKILHDKRVAIVQVVGMLPPGIREHQNFDVIIQALPKNNTTSLAGGELFLTELKINGADPRDPFGKVNDYASAKGFLFVNPAYALDRETTPTRAARQSLRNAVIMDGGSAKFDRPLFLRLRAPERRMSRYIEQRIVERFQKVSDNKVAQAEDEGVVQIYVPYPFRGDWKHFAKLVTHLYLDASPESLSSRARMLADEARKPGALLDDISYAWEGIGQAAIPFLSPLLTDKRPDIAFAAARAGSYIGDPTMASQAALTAIARDFSNPFQLNAVEAIGGLPPSAQTNQMLYDLVDTSDKALVRIEAYKILAQNRDPRVASRLVTERADNQKYILDIVPSKGQPIIYASRTGLPRIALIGPTPQLITPVIFSAIDGRLTINSAETGQFLTMFYRPPAMTGYDGVVQQMTMRDPIKMLTKPDLSEIVQRLGGVCAEGERPFDFTYSEVLGILSRLSKDKKLVAAVGGDLKPVAFMLQEPTNLQNAIYSAPSIDEGRPQQDASRDRDAADAVVERK